MTYDGNDDLHDYDVADDNHHCGRGVVVNITYLT